MAGRRQSRLQKRDTRQSKLSGERQHGAPRFFLGTAIVPESKLRIRAGQIAGLDFYGNQEYGDSFLLEPLGYAFGNLFSNVFEPFNPAGTPGAEIQFAPAHRFYVKSAVMSGNRDPYRQDPTGFHFKFRNNPDFLFETGYLVAPRDGTPRLSDSKSYPGIYKFGAVYNGGRFQDAPGRESSGNYLIYGMASQAVFRTDPQPDRGDAFEMFR